MKIVRGLCVDAQIVSLGFCASTGDWFVALLRRVSGVWVGGSGIVVRCMDWARGWGA